MKNQHSTCLICQNPCCYCSPLLNKKVYHIYCYQRILKRIKNLENEIFHVENKIILLSQNLLQSKTMKSALKRKLLLKNENLGSLQPRIEYLNRDLKELVSSKEIYEKIIRKLYNYWPTLPPDWSERCNQILSLQKTCFICGRDSYDLEVNYKIPISRGGNHKLKNLMALCERCASLSSPKIFKVKKIQSLNLGV
jgi:hypothetical protein